ncbi:3-keto-5-aminohexanoate cleavage protein [Murimonas intestini]|uniref:3-keto-5-aminohexanoate cleavage enzyme n=1 Tax=Murimonas intestini TaxID=1337051 RepID=A0AB73T756_9FIRM|nr:3-keto-5-aminohexanoate cleavage protein [Murimonas intestini]MCR1841320.1 3-keto-5-aminohexanoate cleavage protein [Murimonas intestini]MCR1866238.1 3-keto-5-aminohexanoate cleavage protein [Murimonas intestini]MCR1882645.1 3-keto-5-aminohexanoate cleavage protein [Murimonas intestini]
MKSNDEKMSRECRKVIISLAPVAAGTPTDVEKLGEDVRKSWQAGAAMCHLHCRKPDGSLTPDTGFLTEQFEYIAENTDMIIQASTGGVSDMNIEERCRPLDYWRVESASLNGGTTNLGEAVYINSFEDIRYCARAVYERGIIPEIEVFDIGMIYNIEYTKGQAPYREPVLYNLVFGHKGGMQPDIDCLCAFRGAVPPGAKWGVTHFGRDNWDFLAAAIAMGASVVRIGFEDSAFLGPEETAKQNYQLVERLVRLIRAMGLEAATPREAREIMGILPRTEK